jgi:hypothetical protein
LSLSAPHNTAERQHRTPGSRSARAAIGGDLASPLIALSAASGRETGRELDVGRAWRDIAGASLVTGATDCHNPDMVLRYPVQRGTLAALLFAPMLLGCAPTAPTYSPYPPEDNNSAQRDGGLCRARGAPAPLLPKPAIFPCKFTKN